MPKNLKSARISIYECNISGNSISKGKWVKGYYGLLPLVQLLGDSPLESAIIKDLESAKSICNGFDFPVLVVSHYLGSGDLSKPLPRPPGSLTIKSVGGLINLKRIVGIPIRRKKIPKTERWEALIDRERRVIKLEGHRLRFDPK